MDSRLEGTSLGLTGWPPGRAKLTDFGRKPTRPPMALSRCDQCAAAARRGAAMRHFAPGKTTKSLD